MITRFGILLLLLGLASGVAATPSYSQQTPQELLESQRRLEQIRRERAQLREEMTRIRSRVSDLSSELRNVESQVNTSAQLLGELEGQLAQREQQILDNTIELEHTREQLAERRAVLHERLREIYKRGPLQTLQVLLAAESFSELLNRYRYLLLIARHDRQLADEVAGLERQLVVRERLLRSNVLQLESVRRDRELEFQELEQLRAQQGAALSGVRTREQTAAERLQQLETDEARVAGLITSLESARQRGELATAAAGRVTTGLNPGRKGTLPWPLEGPILYRFADRSQPGGRSGLGIGGPAGAEVHAIAAGTVVLAGPFESYGPTVVVSHGGGYYSLYLYLGDIRVRQDAVVQQGQAVGTVGRQRAEEGPHLELQIRIPGGQADDPLAWLQAR